MNHFLVKPSGYIALTNKIVSSEFAFGSARGIIDAVAIYSITLTMKLDDKVALITGSARGLGWEMVQAFAQEGAKVAICDLSQSDVDGAAARLGLPPEKVLGVKADVTSEREVGDLFTSDVGEIQASGYPGEQRRLCLAARRTG